MEKIIEYNEEEYKEFFEWLLEKDVHINVEPDITLLNTHKKPYIYYPDEIRKILESNAMQRLGRVSQLGNIIDSNPIAYNTRLAHSKGAGNNATKFYIKQFKTDERWRKKVEDDELKLEVLADIIQMYTHDIGHNILSHSLEKFIESKGKINEVGAAHEILGKRIINEDEQIVEILKSIHPNLLDTLNKVSKCEYSLRTLKEGAVDWDRMDFLVRDKIYLGKQEERYNVESIIQNTEIDDMLNQPVYDEQVKENIKQLLEDRNLSYKNIYVSNETHASTAIIIYLCEKLQNSSYECDLKSFIEHCVQNGGDGIDLNEFLAWDDVRYYNELINIARNCPDEDIKEIAICCLPNLKSLRNIGYELLGMDKNDICDLTGHKWELYQNIKRLISDKDELHNRLRDRKEKNVFLNAFSKEDVHSVFASLEVAGIDRNKLEKLICWEKHIKKYSKSDPIYIKSKEGKVELLDYEKEFGSKFAENIICGVLALPIQMREANFSDDEIVMVHNAFAEFNLNNIEEQKQIQDEKMVYELEDMLHKRWPSKEEQR